jgi:hypothetical protein
VDVSVITIGGVEDDLIKFLAPTYTDDFSLPRAHLCLLVCFHIFFYRFVFWSFLKDGSMCIGVTTNLIVENEKNDICR